MGGGGAAAAGGGGGGGGGAGEYGSAKTSVWWDIENCAVPRGSDPHAIAQNISSALAEVGFRGPVSISAYGDTQKIPTSVQHALSSTGVALNHVPAGVKDASDKKILVDMLFWAVDNPPPANYLLISGDRDFSNALHQLRMRRYNILLAHSPNVSQALVAAAKIVWLWTSLLAGGTPLQNSDSSYPCNGLNGHVSSEDACKKSSCDTLHIKQSSDSSSENSYLGKQKSNGYVKADGQYKGKQKWRKPTQLNTNTPRTSSHPPESSEGCANGSSGNHDLESKFAMQQSDQVSMPRTSSCEVQGSTQASNTAAKSSFSHMSPQKLQARPCFSDQPDSKQFKEAPHELFGATREFSKAGKASISSGPTPNHVPPHSVKPMNNGNNFPKSQQTQYPQPLRPSDLLPSQDAYASGNFYASNTCNPSSHPPPPRPYVPPFTSGPPLHTPDMTRLNISDYSSTVHHNTSLSQQYPEPKMSKVPRPPLIPHNIQPVYNEKIHRPQRNALGSNMTVNGGWETQAYQTPPIGVQGLINNILHALDTLKADKIAPTEANIAECIRFGEMNIQNFDVRIALDHAIHHQAVVVHKLGSNLPFFIRRNDMLWKCVNIMDIKARHPKSVWDAVYKFLSSDSGRSSILASRCRYQAAIMLKKSCFNHLVLGDVLQILYVIIHVKKWILPHSSGWQPLSFTLIAASDTDTDADDNTGRECKDNGKETNRSERNRM